MLLTSTHWGQLVRIQGVSCQESQLSKKVPNQNLCRTRNLSKAMQFDKLMCFLMEKIFIRSFSSSLRYCINSTYFCIFLTYTVQWLFIKQTLAQNTLIQIRSFLPDATQCATTETVLLVHLFYLYSSSGDNLDIWPELNKLHSSLITAIIFSGSPETSSTMW